MKEKRYICPQTSRCNAFIIYNTVFISTLHAIMKHFHSIALSLIVAAFAMPVMGYAQTAQNQTITAAPVAAQPQKAPLVRLAFGYINYNNVLQAMADYAVAQQTMQNLRQQYDKEAAYNEDKFFKMYSDYIQGQKTFPQDIMLKRQKELQVAMDQGILFRQQSEKNLEKAEQELLDPIRQKLDAAISTVAKEKGYAFVLNTDGHACPYINPLDGTDITLMVEAVLSGKPVPKTEEPVNIAPKTDDNTTAAPAEIN